MRSWILIAVLIIVHSVLGCASGTVTLPQQNISLGELKSMIHGLVPVGIRSISANGREFVSQTYIVQKGEYYPSKDSRVRYTARILILNSSRPFDIQINVKRESRELDDPPGKYYSDGFDQNLAELLKSQVRERLAKRRDDVNFLDDFRVF